MLVQVAPSCIICHEDIPVSRTGSRKCAVCSVGTLGVVVARRVLCPHDLDTNLCGMHTTYSFVSSPVRMGDVQGRFIFQTMQQPANEYRFDGSYGPSAVQQPEFSSGVRL